MAADHSLRTRIIRRLVDGLSVVTAILAAFALDAWWERQSEQAQVEEGLSALYAEWTGELEKIDTALGRIDQNRSAIVALLRLHQSGAPDLQPDSADALWAAMAFSTYKPSVGALNSLLLTRLEGVEQADLRSAIAEWTGVIAGLSSFEVALSELGTQTYRREIARVAATTERPWVEEEGSWLRSFGLPSGELALMLTRSEVVSVLLRETLNVLLDYQNRLRQVRGTLVDNVALLVGR